MAENVTIARPYAEAAFKQADGAGALGPWSEALDKLAAVAADPQMQTLIHDPKLGEDKLAELFIGVVGDLDESQKNFVRILVENERLQVLPEIRDLFVERKNEREGTLDADIVSAFELDDATLNTLTQELEARFKAKLNVSVSVDPDLIGGVTVTVGDDVIDASVRGKLANMAAALKI
ncbi:F0F1 ATP synthase subunit delta [Nitrogeniibacter mangrovi]|uniref:ATP synthase subunit delta n=1 Tax=Nitrogeniibacter mangrovi TaxID=2016596 RepID=A0A6C1B0K0_9RHOO|nr:F0F1 ATP synthase subunit delta [Nitrogeniibacter mangrovi]QID16348.1 F0F1 ATP synthase subunit delta [Nitrogeniibacter mangrovi]